MVYFTSLKVNVFFLNSIGFTFGIILCISGFGGVVVGLLAAKKYSQKRNDSDALICAVGWYIYYLSLKMLTKQNYLYDLYA